ncbi:MAG: glycosyltransferase [Candidatus Thorarchaeota archaeon]|jgi:cellulose synthase/poly-beta-1,6-N-acetylglucosamine synthase-like glycosyltransferase
MDIVMLLNYAVAFFSLFVVSVFFLLFLRHRHDYLQAPEKTDWRPVVSVVIPAYNEGDYIKESIMSVLAVDYPQDLLDIIVVDDGSTDDTYQIAKKFAGGPVRVFTKKNSGKGAALNFGLKKAKGELVATMDADSYLTKNTITELLPYFEDPDVMAVTPAVKIMGGKSWLKELQRVEYLIILFSRKLLSFIDSVPVTPGPFSMFRTSVFDEVGNFDEHNLVEDQEIALRIQSHHYKIRSSMSADVYTEPPGNIRDLLRQRVRWQRGGFRNYWKYKFMIKPEYGDFGMYFVPLNFATITGFFILMGLMIYSFVSTPYYVKYMWLDAYGLGIGLFTFIGAFVIATSILFMWLSVKSFEGEKVKLRYLFAFLIFYWYLMIGYNVLFVLKEIRKEGFSW